jgi:hypothetical protein
MERIGRVGRSNGTIRGRHAATAVVAVAALVLVACRPAIVTQDIPPLPEPVPGVDDAFTIVFIGDTEQRMRGNTDAEVRGYIEDLVAYTTTEEAYFDYGDGTHRIDPELVILGGDISADRDTYAYKEWPVFQPLYDAGIGFIAGFGNHDWDPPFFGDGTAGYSVAGHLSNEGVVTFTRETYKRTAALLPDDFTYRELQKTSAQGPVTFHATFRGVEIANFNTFLYQPSYFYPEGWSASCNPELGGAGCQTFVSAERQIQAMERTLTNDPRRTLLVVQHYPLSTSDGWWSDFGASGTTVQQKKDRLLSILARYEHSALFAGHNHSASTTTYGYQGKTITEHVAPYFGGAGGDDPTQGGGFLAILVSPTRGILEVERVAGSG